MSRNFVRFLRKNTIALLALFFALGGTTFAAATVALPANSVGAKQLKKNAVINKKIMANAVTGAKVKNDSLTGADVLESSLGMVPSAGNATNASHADTATNATNATNAANATNATNAASATNATNAASASSPATLASGKTEKGVFGFGATGASSIMGQISFPFPLASAPTFHIIHSGVTPPAGCSGSVADPGAAPGHLCIFEGYTEGGATLANVWSPVSGSHVGFTLGLVLWANGGGSGNNDVSGTWAVTAP